MPIIDLAEYRAKRRPPPTEWAQFKAMCDQYDSLRVPIEPQRAFDGWVMVGLFALIVSAIIWIVWG